MAFSLFVQVTVIGSLSWLLWKVFRNFVVKSPLDNLPGPPPASVWKGNLGQLFSHNGWDFQDELGEKYGPIIKITGLFNERLLYVFDPKALQSIIIKDQYAYEQPPAVLQSRLLLFGPGILSTSGDWHRRQRKMLNPVFSIAHLRRMIPMFYKVTLRLQDAIAKQVKDGAREIDILHWMGRTALELIGQGGLGHSFDPLVGESADTFGDAMKALVPNLSMFSAFRSVLKHAVKIGSPRFRRRVIDILPIKALHALKDISDTINKRCEEIFLVKKALLESGDQNMVHQVGEGKDLMSLLLKANTVADKSDQLGEEELLAQLSSLVFAATDTTSNALAHIIHILAEHQDVQNKLREEIRANFSDSEDEMAYDQLVNLPYLDAVCRETMRLYPPLTQARRQALRSIVLPLSNPVQGKDGKLIHEIIVPKNTVVHIGIRQSNRNKAIWGEDACEWKPERWLKPLPKSVTEAGIPGVYSNLMTFLGGGRSCIGFKFSQLEMKVVLSVLLRSFKFSLSSQEIVWKLASIKYPTVGRDSNKPSLPIKVERV